MTGLGRALFIYAVACLVGYLVVGGLVALAWPQ